MSALTTCGLIFLPGFYAPAEGFDGRMARVHDPAYVLRSYVYLLHPFITGAAALAVALLTACLIFVEVGGPGLPSAIEPWVHPPFNRWRAR